MSDNGNMIGRTMYPTHVSHTREREHTMRVWFIPLTGIDPNDEHAYEHIDHYVVEGTLTTEHPMSSYGLPVIVDEAGVAYGPGDIYDGNWSGDCRAPRNLTLEQAASRAGYRRESNASETETTY